jgi:mRNA interferase MazF
MASSPPPVSLRLGREGLSEVAALMEQLRGQGDVHAISLPSRRGHVQHGRRFAVIVQADGLLALSTILVCPTSSSTPAASFHPDVTIAAEPTRVMSEMVGAVDARRLGARVDHLSLDDMRSVDDALELVLGLR